MEKMKAKKNTGFRKIICLALLAVLLADIGSAVPANAAARKDTGSVSAQQTDSVVLKKKGGKYRCYQNGKPVKNQWMTIRNKKYYFGKNGDAATLSAKIDGAYYVFNTKGVLQQPSSTSVLTIGKKKYQVTPKGKAKPGWSEDKKQYFDKSGEILTGTQVIKEEFYAFSSNGNYDKSRTEKLRDAAKYEKNITTLRKLIGKPLKTNYYEGSCYMYKNQAGDDGVWEYRDFTVYTFRTTGGTEIFMGAEGK